MERKRLISLVGGLCLTVIGTVGAKAQEVYITVENKSTEDVFLQPEDTTGYRKVLPGTTVMKPVVDGACYYRFVDANSNFYSLYVEPGDTLELLYDGKKLSWSGTKARVQTFLDEHRYIGRAPEPIKTYSQEWVHYNEEKLGELYGLLDRSGLPANFVAVHKEYLRFVFLNLRLNARTMQMFGHGADAGRNYYDFLRTLTFGDSLILCLPKWFSVMKDAMEEMEKQGFLTVSATHYLPIYAERITDEKLRSRFLVEMLRFTLRKGFSDDFNVYVDDVRPLITDRKALDDLAEIEKQYLTLREKNKDLLRGMEMPDFTAYTQDGKAYTLSDMKGKVVVIDFWFTGCIPCRAEMPYFDRLAETFKDRPVQFLSVSLDTGDQLMALWKKMVSEKDGKSPVLNLNLPGGFRSDFTARMNIRSVPRVVLVDKDGRIVDAYAKRPSDPKLKLQLEKLMK